MNRQKSKRNFKRKPRRQGQVVQVIESRRNPSFPPQNNTKPKSSRVLRYSALAAATAAPITARCLLNLVLGINTATTLAINIYEAIRVKSICMYHAPSSVSNFGSGTDELILTWRGANAPDTRMSDRGTLTHPACIKSRPPKDSLCGFWITNQSNLDNLLCEITLPQNALIDVSVEMTIGDGTTRSVTLTAVGSAIGLGYAALDNAIVAGTVGGQNLRPDSLTYSAILTP